MSIDKVLICALGNPGEPYRDTRHNIGFALADNFVDKYGIDFVYSKKFNAEIFKGQIFLSFELKNSNEKLSKKIDLIFAKPLSFMNESGRVLAAIAKFYKINYKNILVLHDDVSLMTGKIKIAFGRGAGGQHGVENIIENFAGSKDFYRLRLGLGPDPGGDLRSNYVLAKIPQEQKLIVDQMLEQGLQILENWLSSYPDLQQINKLELKLI